MLLIFKDGEISLCVTNLFSICPNAFQFAITAAETHSVSSKGPDADSGFPQRALCGNVGRKYLKDMISKKVLDV